MFDIMIRYARSIAHTEIACLYATKAKQEKDEYHRHDANDTRHANYDVQRQKQAPRACHAQEFVCPYTAFICRA